MKRLALLVLMAVATCLSAQNHEENRPAVLTATNGRYVFGQISMMRADQFLLDTQTGRLWQMRVDKNGVPALYLVPIEQAAGALGFIPEAESNTAAIRLGPMPPADAGTAPLAEFSDTALNDYIEEAERAGKHDRAKIARQEIERRQSKPKADGPTSTQK